MYPEEWFLPQPVELEIFKNDWNGPRCREQHQRCENGLLSSLSNSTWIISIPMVNISVAYSEETKELFVHADHLLYFHIKYIVSLTINCFIPQCNRF